MKVNSTNLAWVDWTEVKGGIGTLEVIFRSGDNYLYKRVPKGIYEKLLAASSKGKFFDQFVVKAGYDYTKVIPPHKIPEDPGGDTLPPSQVDILRSAFSDLEKKGMVKREQDEQGNIRIVLVGEITKELFGK